MINIVRDTLESIVYVNRAKVLAGARKAALVGVALIMFMMTIAGVMSFKTSEVMAEESTGKTYVIDDAGILSTSEEQSLSELCKKASDKCQVDIIVITMNQNLDYSPMDTYLRSILEKQYGYNGTGSNCDAVVYGIDMTSRADRIVTSGRARSDISQSKLDSIRESAENRLSDGDYYKGCKKYIQGIERQLNTSIVSKMTYYMPVKLGISAVIAIVAVLAMMSSAKAKMTVSSTEYTKNHNYDVADRRDIFINTTVTTRHIQTSSGSSSGGGSSGGNSGSSGGHF